MWIFPAFCVRPGAIRSHYNTFVDLLLSVEREARGGVRLIDRFHGLTTNEIMACIRSLRRELEAEATLALTASFEAVVRLDYGARAVRKHEKKSHITRALRSHEKKSHITRALRSLGKKSEGRFVSIEEILDVWKDEQSECLGVIGKFKQLVNYRNWLAHGRYYPQKSGLAACEPEDAWEIGCDLIEKLYGERVRAWCLESEGEVESPNGMRRGL